MNPVRRWLIRRWLMSSLLSDIGTEALRWLAEQDWKQDDRPREQVCNHFIRNGGTCTLPANHLFPLHIARAPAGNVVGIEVVEP